jgi:3-oxoacyl-[acyl-carrier protein] reductase
VSIALAQAGVKVVVCGRRKNCLDDTVNIIKAAGGDALSIQADISDPTDVERLAQEVLKYFGQIDILINNAGIYLDSTDIQLSKVEDWDMVMATNLRGPYLMTQSVLPTMRAQHGGHIIYISSEAGLEFNRGDSVYGTSKHALNALAEFVVRENQDFDIRVNTICPGMVVSEMTEDSIGLDHSKCLYPEDIADLVIWLLTRRKNIKIGTPILIQTMLNPWE